MPRRVKLGAGVPGANTGGEIFVVYAGPLGGVDIVNNVELRAVTPSPVGVLVLHPGATGRALAIKDHLVLELAGPTYPGVGAGHGVAVGQVEGEVNVPFITGGRAIVVVPQDVVQDVDPVHVSLSLEISRERKSEREREREREREISRSLSLSLTHETSLSLLQDLFLSLSQDLEISRSQDLKISRSLS